MNYTRILLAAVSAFVAYMVFGALTFVAIPSLKDEFSKFPAVYRDHQGQMSHMPIAMIATFISMLVLTTLYAYMYQTDSGIRFGLTFGALIGIMYICSFVLHNFVNLNIGLRLTIYSAIAYFIQCIIVGIVISLIYKPAR